MNKIIKFIFVVFLLILVSTIIWDFYVNKVVKGQLDTIRIETKIQLKEKELILSIKPSEQLPKFSRNYFIVLTSESEKIDVTHFERLGEEITFSNKDQDLYNFKINDPNREIYQLKFKPLEGEQDLKKEEFTITLKSQPYTLWSNEFYLSKSFKFNP